MTICVQTIPHGIPFLLTRLIRGMTCAGGKAGGTADKFLLTRLIRGMTFCRKAGSERGVISTHTPHTRHDVYPW